MDKVKAYVRDKWFYIVVFCVPIAIAICHSVINGTWIVGNGSLFRGDTTLWSVPFYYELWDRVHAGESLVYGWNIASGYDIYAHILNCVMSPFTLLMMITPREWIVGWVHAIMLIHWGSAALTMTYFFYHTKYNVIKGHRKIVALFLGMSFAMCNGMINYLSFLQWGLTYAMFPLLLLLLERMVENGKWKLYYIVLTISIIGNYYISFHICLFLILWFFLQMTSDRKKMLIRFLQFASASLLSGISAMFVIVPSYFISSGRFGEDSNTKLSIFIKQVFISVYEFFEQFFIMTPLTNSDSLKPNIYCSLLVVVLAVMFCFVKMNKKKKIYMLGVTLLLTASFFFGFLNIIWHCFAVPNLIFNRFVVVYVFWLAFLTLHVLNDIADMKPKNLIIGSAIIAFVAVLTFLNIEGYNEMITYLLTFVVVAIYIVIFVLYDRKSILKHQIIKVLCIVGIAELCINGFYEMYYYSVNPFWDEQEMLPTKELCKEVQLQTGERAIYTLYHNNIGMVMDTDGAGGFSSYVSSNIIDMTKDMGMIPHGEVGFDLQGASPLINLMFNVRYAVSCYDVNVSDSQLIKEEKDLKLYRMNRIAGLGYMVDSDVVSWDPSYGGAFETQNQFVAKTTGENPIFEGIVPKLMLQNYYAETLESDEEYLQYGIHIVPYKATDIAVSAEFVVEEDMDLYTFVEDKNNTEITALVNGEIVYVDQSFLGQRTIHIGNVKKGDNIAIVAIFNEGLDENEAARMLLQFARFNEENYAVAYEKLSRDVYEIEVMDGPYVSGTIDVTEDGIMATSIQAVDGFEVFVDGVQVEYEKIGNALIGVPLTKGTHKVEFKYHTPYAKIGWIISGCGFLLFVILCIVGRKKDVSILCESE